MGWSLVTLRAETLAVPYLDDSSLHEQMVRFATLQLRTGHFPLTTWFPYLGLGSPQFLHYQSLPAILTGVAGLVVGPDAAFRWSLYLLLCLWPVSVYLGARLFGVSRWGAAAAAAMSPFLMSAAGVGYEQRAYLWIGYGVWTQLWAAMTLPLAWGLSWRAVREGRNLAPAAAMVAVTVALHFETGYLALMPLLLWPLVSPGVSRVRRAAVLAGGALLASAWVTVPLIAERGYAATNEILQRTPLANGYGAGRVLGWLVTGQLLDRGRFPVVTLAAALGLAVACVRWRRDEHGRALVVVLAACLVLSFGRTTFGVLADALPGSADIFFRRFMMGGQLAALLLAGTGVAWAGTAIRDRLSRGVERPPGARFLALATAAAGGLALLWPAASQLRTLDQRNATAIAAQRSADRVEGAQLDRLLAIVKRSGGGRVYAGMPSNWGRDFTVGAVPVFKYLESRDVDEVGYTLRTASLMTDPEFYFDEHNPGDYRLFGIRYLIVAAQARAPVPARLVTCAGRYCLHVIPSSGYVSTGRIAGALAADRSTVGVRSIALLGSRLPGDGGYLRLGSTEVRPRGQGDPGQVTAQTAALERGGASATVRMERSGIAVLSASFDGGWTARVDGHAAPVFPVAPALTATSVTAGIHRVQFRYVGFPHYLELFVLAGLSLAALAVYDRRRNRR